ncbi:hypothetical protein [uncultured Clostridium sp.]|mgnify:CR=1 FL=1|uniref:hypothetical protein n=1 Tax=uncultured Clostridium sp. TaxID=59620 RepID=UPI00258DBCBC|nr:hypothetical protein [uncultured Clostridium sp.]
MKSLLSIFTTSILIITTINFNNNIKTTPPKIIDAYILAYDSMYSQSDNLKIDYIILDMESHFFSDTSYEDRQKMINHFNKYDKTIINSSLFNLKEIGLADNFGNIKINGELLMLDCIDYNSYDNNLVIKAIIYKSPISAKFYTIKLSIQNNEWVLKYINLDSVA